MKALNRNKVIKSLKKKSIFSNTSIVVDNGICSLKSNTEVFGIQIKFKGRVEITPELPEGWILQGNNSKMIMISLDGNPIKNQILFSYRGDIIIQEKIISNFEGKKISTKNKNNYTNWESQEFDFSVDTNTWKNYKETRRSGKVKRTIYHLPDYNLPKVENKKINRTIITDSSRSTGGY